MDLDNACNMAIHIARAAGEILRRGLYEQKVIARKSTAIDLLTEHDRAAEALIIEQLQAAFPGHHLVAEESGQLKGVAVEPYTWYIDPLDGTNNFAHGFPVFAVSLALYEGDLPLVGVIYDPTRQECFSAIAGVGTILATPETTVRLQVSRAEHLVDSLLATGFPYDRHTSAQDNVAQLASFLKKAQGVRRVGSAALDLAYVAAGRLDGYWEYKLNPWDVAAGALLVQEAGGRVTAIDGRPLRLATNIALVASNGHIHDALLATLAAVG
ncbi:MAG: inositol monophosphatase [Chloroflexi bacterium]|nr:inositol monophosphatase [Chloroflexota bacterium]MCI0577995.1 inositol monophosphatase [Chloroflexota bacterium]MCI0646976.1 inositol monophosphatase [Chloroflexota bacterium]MCI0729265.1 inositol monophosphatase [Chloroflexota bacterium]